MKRIVLYLVFAGLNILACSSFVFAETLNVPDDFETIQSAINASNNGDIVLVQPGVYTENIDFNSKRITVASLFHTTGDPDFISRTIIDGNGNRRAVSFISQENRHSILKGFTIRNGFTSYGGGIYIRESSPALQNLIITNNHATHRGGGVYCTHSSNPTLTHVTIVGNTADNNYGGIHAFDESNPTIVNSIFWSNNPPDLPDFATITFSDAEGGFEGDGNIDADPLFADAENGDFSLTEQSPCVDAGADVGMEFLDEAPDMGAMEFVILDLERHFEFHITDSNQSLLVFDAVLADGPLSNNSEIGVFTPAGLCCGAGVWIGELLGIAIWGDDQQTEAIDGFQAGEEIAYRLWDCDTQTEYDAIPHYRDGNGIFQVNGFASVELVGIFEPHWDSPEPTDNNHSLLIESAAIDGEPLAPGDEIGIFTQNELLAGRALWVDGGRVGVAAWGDVEHTEDVVEGFVEGEQFTFIIWDCAGEVEHISEARFRRGPDVYTSNSFSVISFDDFDGREGRDLVVGLNRGWDLISINVEPGEEFYAEGEDRGPDVELLMAELTDQGVLEILKNGDGQFFFPEHNFNNIPYWDFAGGFQIKTNADVEFTISGLPIFSDTEMQLSEGWNMIAYFPDYDLSCEAPDFYAFSPILHHVSIAKDGDGNFALPGFNYSNMPPWQEARGYQVKVNADVAFSYPPAEEVVAGANSRVIPEHWSSPAHSERNMSLLITDISGIEAKSGDEVAAFNSIGKIVGVGVIGADGRCGLTVWADNQGNEGESLSLKLYCAGSENETLLGVSEFVVGTDLVYETDSFLVLKSTIEGTCPSEYFLSSAYPNPFNAVTTFTYGLPEASVVSIRVHDINGRLIATITEGVKAAGQHVAVFDGNANSSGIYIIQMNTNGFSATRKVMLVK